MQAQAAEFSGYVSESSSFCLFILPFFKTDGKSWSFRLRGLMDDHAEVGYPSRFQHSTPRRQALRFPAIEKVGRNAS